MTQMTKRERQDQQHMRDALRSVGLSYDEVDQLRRISMTLHRWHELDCGDEHGRCIERDDATDQPRMTYDVGTQGKRGSYPVPDREKGARRRLDAIMQAHPALIAYIQTDPRGCALWILNTGLVPEGGDVDCYYSRGIAVW